MERTCPHTEEVGSTSKVFVLSEPPAPNRPRGHAERMGLRQGSHRKDPRTEGPSTGKVMGTGTEMTFTIKSLVVLFLS